MFRLLGGPARSCDGLTRREVLQIGGLGTLGILLPDLLRAQESARPRTTGKLNNSTAGRLDARAKSCILVFLFGGPSHIDTWDMKPTAPSGIRGEFNPIATNVPGIRICEHFPLLAGQMDKVAIVRSMQHPHPRHGYGLYYMMTGRPHLRPEIDAPPQPDDSPCLGSIVAKFRPSRGGLHPAVTLPRWAKFDDLPNSYAGQNGGFLGGSFHPWLVTSNKDDGFDFQMPGIELPPEVGLNRLDSRKGLLRTLDHQVAALADASLVRATDSLYAQALGLVTSSTARGAFDLSEESPALRDRYGMHSIGQGLLLARRLVEAGVSLVTVNWHRDGSNVKSPFWDTHVDNFKSLKERLIPPTDRALAALLEDLHHRGLLESTLVLVMGEFGRTPKIGRVVMNAATNATGRDHWPYAYSILMAGGGVRGGQVYGSSDRIGGYVADDPVGPADLTATVLWLMGIDPDAEIQDRLGRPFRASDGHPILGLV